MSQLDLLDPLAGVDVGALVARVMGTRPKVRRDGRATSVEAAGDVSGHVVTDLVRVLLWHAGNPSGGTDWELADGVGSQQASAGCRRGSAVTLGLIEPTARRGVTPSGSSAIVWQITPTGAEVARRIRWKLDCGGR